MLARPSKGEANVSDLAKLAGGGGSWNRLAEYLARESSSKEKFAINRSLDTPRHGIAVFPLLCVLRVLRGLKQVRKTGISQKGHEGHKELKEGVFESLYK